MIAENVRPIKFSVIKYVHSSCFYYIYIYIYYSALQFTSKTNEQEAITANIARVQR